VPVVLDGISKRYGDYRVLSDVSFQIGDGEFISLIGPSGVGKTTLLKILADLESPDSGTVRFSEPPGKDRPVVMMFQDFALFPHMTIAENVGYGLKVRGVKKKDRRSRVNEILDWFGITDKADAYPARLSAGQKQRAAIARALVIGPMVLLLDEPFANLDKNLKTETAEFIRRTQKAFGTTTVMVTHDQDEAFAVSDRIGVLIGGTLRQYDYPEVIAAKPADQDTARFLGPGSNGNGGSRSVESRMKKK
jgi:putative spermidine/putrescine transport system ATP-binding protein